MNITKEEVAKLNVKGDKIQWNEIFYTEDKCSFLFKIHGFSFLNDVTIKSSIFSMELNDKVKWYLEFYPQGNDAKEHASLFLTRQFEEPIELMADVLFAIINKNRECVQNFEFTRKFDKDNRSWGKKGFIKIEDLLSEKNDLLPNDSLTIFCSVTTHKRHINCNTKSKEIHDLENEKKNNLLNKLISTHDNFERMFLDDTFTDIILSINGHNIKTHKCLLAASSPVFESILKKDSSMNLITVADVSYDNMILMLRFIYTKKIDNLHQVAHELIFLADKYQIQDLKNICEKSLCQSMNIENVIKMAAIANQTNANILKKLSINLIIKNKKEMCQTFEFKEMIECNPNLKEEIFWSTLS